MKKVGTSTYQAVAFGLTDVGLVRPNNEDIWAQMPEYGFFILADGMGGHQAGEIAAREVVRQLCRIIQKKIAHYQQEHSLTEVKDLLRKAIRHVNASIFLMSRQDQELRGMGTTLCCALVHHDNLIYAHVGDSRLYRYRNNELLQLTKDHSLLRQLIDYGQIGEREAAEFAHKNIITKAIGTEPKVEPTIDILPLQTGDLFLLCSDGLSDLLSKDEIADVISNSPSLEETAQRLIAEANEKGGPDNITVLLVQMQESHQETHDETAAPTQDLSR